MCLPMPSSSRHKQPLGTANSNTVVTKTVIHKSHLDEKGQSHRPNAKMSSATSPAHSLSIDTSSASRVENKNNNDPADSVRTRSRSISPHARAILRRTFSRSRSRSRNVQDDDDESSVSSSSSSHSSTSSASSSSRGGGKQMLVAVTSCRSDAYYAQKAPGAISMLPRKAPSALKTFHELAVGMKDAYEAVGAMPVKIPETSAEWKNMSKSEQEGRKVLFDFMGNVNFLLALVDEVATDSATRGALKDDAAFKSLRDVIKRCNKVLERMLVRRESKYTLFYRLVQPHDSKDIEKMLVWNSKVDKAVSSLSSSSEVQNGDGQNDVSSEVGSVSSAASGGSIFNRGRRNSLGRRTRSRRATPTPRLRNRFRKDGNSNDANAASTSADDGFATVTAGNVAKLQRSLSGDDRSGSILIPKQFQRKKNAVVQPKNNIMPMAPKDELVDMIRELRSEKNKATNSGQPEDLKPNWTPKADVPGAVPKLPIEYIHRHRLMKQVVNSLINRPGAVIREDGQDGTLSYIITSITSRHADKAGNGKTTLAAAAVQSVEVRERFCDGIAWIQLGRAPLSDKDVRRLYEELYDQLLMRDIDLKSPSPKTSSNDDDQDGSTIIANAQLKSRRKFQGADLEGMKEDLGRLLRGKNVLICLDDVWRVEDASRFIFEDYSNFSGNEGTKRIEPCSYRILVTTRTPGLLGEGNANEIFVRIFSEQEAVKLLLSAAGRRLYGGKDSPVFNEARIIVKGCGNSPLALRLAGGMLRTSNRNWTLSSRTWLILVEQCKASLEEASRIRSFVNSVRRIVDLSFVTVDDLCLRASLRRCFVTFAMVFHDNDLLLTGRGIPRGVIRKLFINVISGMEFESNTEVVSPDTIIDMLEHMNLLQRAGHDAHITLFTPHSTKSLNGTARYVKKVASGSLDDAPDDEDPIITDDENEMLHHKLSYLMHESIKHIAAEMASRSSSAFAPKADAFTSYSDELDAEIEREEKMQSSNWLSSAAKYLFSTRVQKQNKESSKTQFHELMAHALLSATDDDGVECNTFDDNNIEKYIAGHLPTHLIRAHMFTKAGDLLLDHEFISRRIYSLGCLEAAQQHMLDLFELRKEHHHFGSVSRLEENDNNAEDASSKSGESSGNNNTRDVLDAGKIVREGSRRLTKAIRNEERRITESGITIDLALCLSTIGEGLLKARQTKESIKRMDEAVVMFRDLLGSYHIEVARSLLSLAKAYIKTGDESTALEKLSEASRIYQSCGATRRYDAISNAQLMANLLINCGDWEQALSKYDEVIESKSSLYGKNSVSVAKAMNDYAIVLAKHSKMSEALRQYEASRSVFLALSPTHQKVSQSHSGDFSFDVTLIDLNIASIKSKLANYEGALESYERGVRGLKQQIEKEMLGPEPVDLTRQTAQRRHLVSAISRIGSLRMKLRDNAGALKAYLMLLDEVDKSAPLSSQMEKAKGHVKCATIYRQMGTHESNIRAVSHLEEALAMYTKLHGANHKDTKAIASSLKQWQIVDKASE